MCEKEGKLEVITDVSGALRCRHQTFEATHIFRGHYEQHMSKVSEDGEDGSLRLGRLDSTIVCEVLFNYVYGGIVCNSLR